MCISSCIPKNNSLDPSLGSKLLSRVLYMLVTESLLCPKDWFERYRPKPQAGNKMIGILIKNHVFNVTVKYFVRNSMKQPVKLFHVFCSILLVPIEKSVPPCGFGRYLSNQYFGHNRDSVTSIYKTHESDLEPSEGSRLLLFGSLHLTKLLGL